MSGDQRPPFEGGIVLLRGAPMSGADAFAAAVGISLRRWYGVERRWVADFDDLVATGQLEQLLGDGAPEGGILILKTHLAADAFLSRHGALVPSLRGRIQLFRTPLDVAWDCHRFLSGVTGALADDEQAFPDFFDRWLQQGGTCRHFADAGFASWTETARETMQADPVLPGPAALVAYDTLLDAPEDSVEQALADAASMRAPLPPANAPHAGNEQPADDVESPGWIAALGSEPFRRALRRYIEQYAAPVNQLIQRHGLSLSVV